jgi:hypothetical protein
MDPNIRPNQLCAVAFQGMIGVFGTNLLNLHADRINVPVGITERSKPSGLPKKEITPNHVMDKIVHLSMSLLI